MITALAGLGIWLLLATPAAVLIGRTVRVADEREQPEPAARPHLRLVA
jgi:hypothetical protein